MKEVVHVFLEIAEKVDSLTQAGNCLEPVTLLLQVFFVQLLQVGQPVSVLSFAALAAVCKVVVVAHSDFLGLITNQTNATSDLRSHGAFEPAFTQQTVDRLDFVPACKKMLEVSVKKSPKNLFFSNLVHVVLLADM